MTNWKNIHPDFTEKLQREWKKVGISYEECEEWIDSGLTVKDAGFAQWLRDIKKMDAELIPDTISKNFPNDESALLNSNLDCLIDISLQNLREQYVQYYSEVSLWKEKYERTLKIVEESILEKEKELEYFNFKLQSLQINYVELCSRSKFQRLITVNKKKEVSQQIEDYSKKIEKLSDELNKLKDEVSCIKEKKINSRKINAQKWLDENYPIEERNEIHEIYLNEPNLEGELDLRDFVYCQEPWGGVKVYILPEIDESKLVIRNISERGKIIFLDAQKYVNLKYPTKKERQKVTKLDISGEKIGGRLNLSDFINLKELFCLGGELTFLNVSECSHLTEIFCKNNLLTSIILPTNLNTLKYLDLSNNDFFTQDLSFLTEATNLERLELGNYDRKKINQGIYNRFTGSLDCLSRMEKLKKLDIGNTDINEVHLKKLPTNLEDIRYWVKFRKMTSKLTEKVVPQLEKYEWKDLNSDFYLGLRREWEKRGFDKKEVKEWIAKGVKVNDYKFVNWLRSGQRLTSEWILSNKDKKEYQELRRRCNEYGWCRQCRQPNTSESWCQSCTDQNWKKLSGQKLIEKFVRQQWNKRSSEIKWISHKQLSNIEYLAEGGFAKVYRAEWKRWHDEPWKIAFKVLSNSQDISLEFLTEIMNIKLVDNDDSIVKCYGISQDPTTNDYMILMDYKKDGDLRKYLQQKSSKLNLKDKLNKLFCIAKGLKAIHKQGLIHRDLHVGNILNDSYVENEESDGEHFDSYITDLGLCQPISYQKEKGKIYGVLPYIAPEVLRGQPYTQASDIYSFGIIAYELLVNAYPYIDLTHDESLAVEICQGLSLEIDKLKIPQMLKDIIGKCLNYDPKKRPTSEELNNIIIDWKAEVRKNGESEFNYQYKEIEEEYDYFSQSTPYQIYPNTITTSRPINTEEIARLLQESEEQALELEIKKIEQEINQPFTDELKELISNFIQARKRMTKDKENEEAEDEAWELEDKLKEKGLFNKDMEKIIEYCERFINLEKQLEKEELQENIAIPPKQ